MLENINQGRYKKDKTDKDYNKRAGSGLKATGISKNRYS